MLKNKLSILKPFMLLLLCLGIQIAEAQNAVSNSISGSEKGGVLFIVIVVVLVLILLFIFFKRLGYFKAKEAQKSGEVQDLTLPDLVQDGLSGEVNAAIAMALHLYSSEIHDQEDPVITMIRVSRIYSPWSSKIYGLRKSPR
jgi:hypothetical protein